MSEDPLIVVIERSPDETIFVQVFDDFLLNCIDENGNDVELTKEERKYIFIKYKNGECDARYSWGTHESNAK